MRIQVFHFVKTIYSKHLVAYFPDLRAPSLNNAYCNQQKTSRSIEQIIGNYLTLFVSILGLLKNKHLRVTSL